MRSVWRPAGATAAVLLAAVTVSQCAVNPATGERELSLVGEGQEIQMGRDADQQIVASIGLYEDAALQEYVDRIGQRLAAGAERPNLPWTFRVLDDASVNAFALPGGFVYLTRGILTHLNSEAEVAGILGHEIAHITAKHSVSQISRAQLTQLGLGLGSILVPQAAPFAELAGAGAQLLFLKFGRDDENQADELGVRYMVQEGYAPAELADVMQMLERASRMGGAQGRLPEWLSTHPDPANRVGNIIDQIAEVLGAAEARVVRREEYLRRIDNVVFGANPREGFFEENVFKHPELRFQMTFPSGWQTVNQKQAVQGVSPNQDAAIQLTLAEGSPSQALQRMASDQNIRILQSGQETINGLPAVMARFAAATQQGTLVGLVAFISHGDLTYQILGYGPEQRWNANERLVSGSIGSFAPLTDPQALAVQPKRLDVVTLSQPMAFSTFLQRYPSAVEPEVVALINQMEVGGTFPGGTLAKRVTDGG
ncbi:MAG: M48 family metalloprotease [Gemmatimonadetes bacterium]|nr:M48 family metalloprotease [Gemmatimonadota bacterium]